MQGNTASAASNLAGTAFRDHAAELQRFLIRRVRHPQDADDLAQEVFARFLRARNTGQVREPLAYLLGIASHVVCEFIHHKQRERVLFDSALTHDRCENSEYEAEQDLTDRLELQQRLERALTRLPPTHQLVVLLVKRDGLSYVEAAQSAGLSVHTIEKYMVEARARLRLMLADE